MGNPNGIAELIPWLIWAIIKASHHYYSTVCTKEDLDPKEGQPLHLATAGLDAYMFGLNAKLNINVKGIPEQWKPSHKWPAPASTPTATRPSAQNDSNLKQQSSNPFNPAGGADNGQSIISTNPDLPNVFALNDTF